VVRIQSERRAGGGPRGRVGRDRLDPVRHDVQPPVQAGGQRGAQLVAFLQRGAQRDPARGDSQRHARARDGRTAHEVQPVRREDPRPERQREDRRRVAVDVHEVRLARRARQRGQPPRQRARRVAERRRRRQRSAPVRDAGHRLEHVDVGLGAAAAVRQHVQDPEHRAQPREPGRRTACRSSNRTTPGAGRRRRSARGRARPPAARTTPSRSARRSWRPRAARARGRARR
jgi:hypothetical protein